MDTRVCKVCGVEKPAVKGSWVMLRGKPSGLRCLRCSALRAKEYHALQMQTNHTEYRSRLLEYQREYQRAYYHANKLDEAFISDKRLRNRLHQQLNLGQARAIKAKRRSAKLKRTPPWLTAEDLRQIQNVYSLARLITEATGVVHHVDHIVPLQGKLVSGLHVLSNLTILSASENSAKGNRYEL